MGPGLAQWLGSGTVAQKIMGFAVASNDSDQKLPQCKLAFHLPWKMQVMHSAKRMVTTYKSAVSTCKTTAHICTGVKTSFIYRLIINSLSNISTVDSSNYLLFL
jgi:hypothetical protein